MKVEADVLRSLWTSSYIELELLLPSGLRNCVVKVEVDVLGFPSRIVRTVSSVGVKLH